MDDDIGTQCIELFKDKPLPYKKQYYHHFNMRKINFMPTGGEKYYVKISAVSPITGWVVDLKGQSNSHVIANEVWS